MEPPYTGGCQCGAIRYEITAKPLTLYACHCTDCQKQSASAFGMTFRIKGESLKITAGTTQEWHTVADSGNAKVAHFCGTCGTRLYNAPARHPGALSIKAGTLDDTSWLRPVGSVWTRSAQPWVTVPPSPLNHETQPDSMQSFVDAWQEENG